MFAFSVFMTHVHMYNCLLYACTYVLRLFSTVSSYQHAVTCKGRTLLPHYLGMYRLTVNNAETYWIVMRNVLSSSVQVHRKFDLKGSTVDRAASHKEKVSSWNLVYVYIQELSHEVAEHTLGGALCTYCLCTCRMHY